MMKSLKLAVVQFTPEFGKKTDNLNRIENLTEGLKADIIIQGGSGSGR
jgi:predicted amidohydrolase